jgi:cytochrome c oxidase subunit 4
MADTHDPGAPPAQDEVARDAHGHEIFRAYMVVAVALCIFTALSFVVNYQVRAGHFSTQTGFALILGVAICKATLVGMYFMHLKFEWGKLYFMIIPAFILGTMMMLVLLPDIVFVWTGK